MENNFEDPSLNAEERVNQLKLEDETKKEIETVVADLHFLRTFTSETLMYFEGYPLDTTQLFAVGLLERIRHSSFSLIRAYDIVELEPPQVFSMGLTLRALILDYLIMLRAIQVVDETQEAGKPVEEVVESAKLVSGEFLADGVEQTLKYFENMESIGKIDNATLKGVYNNLGSRYSLVLNQHPNDGTRPVIKYNRAPSPAGIFNLIYQHRLMSNISMIYDAYSFFSKFDHFGIIYFDTIRTRFDKAIHHCNKVIKEILFHTGLVCSFLHDAFPGDKFIEDRFKNINSYIDNNYYPEKK